MSVERRAEPQTRSETGTIAIAIPAYQAGPYLRDVADRALEVARSHDEIGHVLVVDDGSSDETAQIARDAGCEVISHAVNRGKGAALRTAFGRLLDDYEAVITLDADGQHLPEEIPRLLGPWRRGADLVLGTRDHLFVGMNSVRRWSNRISSRLISLAAGRPLLDVQTGFRLYSRRLLEAVPLRGDRFEAESGVVVRAARHGFDVVSVPVRLGFADGRHTSHYRPWVDSLKIARAVIGARLRPGNPSAEREKRVQE